jgi:hypothetical protein
MISNESQWGRPRQPQRQPQPYYQHPQYQNPEPYAPRPAVHEDTLASRELQIERKHLLLSLKENPRGRFLRITEETNGRFNSIIIPVAGLKDFQKLLEDIVKADGEIPAKNQPPLP